MYIQTPTLKFSIIPTRTTRTSRACSSSISVHTCTQGTRTPVASNRHLSPHLILIPECQPDKDFPEIARNHPTEPTLDRDNPNNNHDDPGDDGPGDNPWEELVD